MSISSRSSLRCSSIGFHSIDSLCCFRSLLPFQSNFIEHVATNNPCWLPCGDIPLRLIIFPTLASPKCFIWGNLSSILVLLVHVICMNDANHWWTIRLNPFVFVHRTRRMSFSSLSEQWIVFSRQSTWSSDLSLHGRILSIWMSISTPLHSFICFFNLPRTSRCSDSILENWFRFSRCSSCRWTSVQNIPSTRGIFLFWFSNISTRNRLGETLLDCQKFHSSRSFSSFCSSQYFFLTGATQISEVNRCDHQRTLSNSYLDLLPKHSIFFLSRFFTYSISSHLYSWSESTLFLWWFRSLYLWKHKYSSQMFHFVILIPTERKDETERRWVMKHKHERKKTDLD